MNKVREWIKANSVFIIVFTVCFVLMILKCVFYPGGSADESFYLATPIRLVQGDSLIVQEWHLSQLSSIIIYPIMLVYSKIVNIDGGGGIILTFRLIYLFIHSLVTIFLYFKLKKYGVGAIIATIAYYCYIPVSIPALSYNTIGLSAVAIISVILLTEKEELKVKNGIIVGIFLSVAVLCCPFFVLAYVLYSALVLIIKVKNKKIKMQNGITLCSGKAWLSITLSCVACVIVFLIFLLTRCSVKDIFKSIPHILNDPEHESQGLFPLVRFFIGFVGRHKLVAIVACGGVLFAGAGIYLFVKDTNRKEHSAIYVLIVSVPVVLCNVVLALKSNNVSYAMVAINVIGLICFLLTENKEWKWLYIFWSISIVYSYSSFLGSNTGLSAICQGLAVAVIGSVMMICDFLKEHPFKKGAYSIYILLIVVLTLQPITQIGIEANKTAGNYIDTEIARFEEGPKAGIYASKNSIEADLLYMKDLEELTEVEGETVCYFSYKIWLYLYTNNKNGAYSAWLGGINEHNYTRLLEYYEINPEKIPDYVFLDGYYPWCRENYQRFAQTFGYTVKETVCGYLLYK